MTSLPPFPSTWTAPTSCFASTNYFRVLLTSNFFSNMYGTPTPVLTGIYPTGDCWPPSSTPGVPYLITEGGCPAGYTKACATAGPSSRGKPVSTLTCCPSVTREAFSFMCRENEYGCHGTYTPGAVWTGVVTNIGIPTPTEAPITRTPLTDEGLEAWGIKLISVAPLSTTTQASTSATSSTSTTVTSTNGGANGLQTNTSTPEPQASLSTGATAGIAVGAVAIVAILGIAAFFVWRRKRKAAGMAMNNPGAPSSTAGYQDGKVELKDGYQRVELNADHHTPMLDAQDSRQGRQGAWELQG